MSAARTIPILLALLLSGCVTSIPRLDGSKPGLFEATGQVAQQGERRIVADFLLRTVGPGDAELSLFKGPGAPLLEMRLARGRGWVSGQLAGPGWSGAPSFAPRDLRPWFEALDRLSAMQPPASTRVRTTDGTVFDFRIQ
jgi:hypothetical protein